MTFNSFLYLGNQTVLITEAWQLPLGRKTVAVYSKDCKKHISALDGYSMEFLSAEADGMCSFNELKACSSVSLIINNALTATFCRHGAYFIYTRATVHLPQYLQSVLSSWWRVRTDDLNWNGKNELPTSSLRTNLNIRKSCSKCSTRNFFPMHEIQNTHEVQLVALFRYFKASLPYYEIWLINRLNLKNLYIRAIHSRCVPKQSQV
jgi:hypothetical protein